MNIEAKTVIQCDQCKSPISVKSPNKSKEEKEDLVETIEATLNMPNGETKEFQLCSEECLRLLLNARKKKNAKASIDISAKNNNICSYRL